MTDTLFYDEVPGDYFYIPANSRTVWPNIHEPDGLFPKLFGNDEALELSIKKWEFIVSTLVKYLPEEPDVSIYCNDCDSCALCMNYVNCQGCPINTIGDGVHRKGCANTPWEVFRGEIGGDQLEVAVRELDFLKSLRRSV